MLTTLLLVAALVAFLCAFFGAPTGRFNLTALGLSLVTIAELVPHLHG